MVPLYLNGDILDYLSIVNTENTSQLQPVGNGYFKAADESIMLLVDQDAVHINSGYLEKFKCGSNDRNGIHD